MQESGNSLINYDSEKTEGGSKILWQVYCPGEKKRVIKL